VVARAGLRDIRATLTVLRYERSATDDYWTMIAPSISSILQSKASGSNQFSSLGCRENLLLAAHWLRKCLTSHSIITISTHPNPPLPTRVLDVGNRRAAGIRLVDGMRLRGPYVTLSHVWGNSKVIMTELETLQQRQECTLLKDLPRTFRDAVYIARQLMVRYLWIDSLCKKHSRRYFYSRSLKWHSIPYTLSYKLILVERYNPKFFL
jgi:hypothetical protein